MLLYSQFSELHEGDVQMLVEELWEGTEHSSRDSETHTDHSPWVRAQSFWESKGFDIEEEQLPLAGDMNWIVLGFSVSYPYVCEEIAE